MTATRDPEFDTKAQQAWAEHNSKRRVTTDEAFRAGLEYIADCLEKDEVYTVHNDRFVRGEAIKPILAKFARKLTDRTYLEKWREWVEQRK